MALDAISLRGVACANVYALLRRVRYDDEREARKLAEEERQEEERRKKGDSPQ